MNEFSAEVGKENEDRGFRTALFINLTKYYPNCVTSQRDAIDNFDKLSIESNTPATSTPKSHEKRESNFKFCLSKDLLRRLEEESPIKRRRMEEAEDINNCLLALDEEEIESHSIKNENNSDCSSEPNGLFRRPILNSFSTNNATSDSECNLTPHKNDSFTENSELNGKSKSSGKLVEEKNSLSEEQIALNTCPECEKNNCEGTTMNCKNNPAIFTSKYINRASDDLCLGSKSDKFNNTSSHNFLMNSNFYNNPYMLLYNNMNGGNCMNYNYGVGSININGKNGWICLVCNNFNYEIRVKCNRCSKPRPQLLNQINQNLYIEKNSTTNSTSGAEVRENEENRQFNGTSKSLGEAKNNSTGKKKKPFQEREGDWNCFKCKNLNFSFRVICNRCQLSKKESENLTSLNNNLKKDEGVSNSARPK